MEYAKHYERLIERARDRVLSDYSETHHVIPKCLGGSDHPDNLVRLTGPEHYVAHLLLVKMHPANSSLAYAAYIMTWKGPDHHGRSKNKLYDWLRRRISSEAKKRVGNKNGSFGTRWITNGVINEKVSNDYPLPEGWRYGRFRPRTAEYEERYCPKCGKRAERRVKTTQLFCSNSCASTDRPYVGKHEEMRWMNDGQKSVRVLKENVDEHLENGWKLGRSSFVKRTKAQLLACDTFVSRVKFALNP